LMLRSIFQLELRSQNDRTAPTVRDINTSGKTFQRSKQTSSDLARCDDCGDCDAV
jgi:hypothetical protein